MKVTSFSLLLASVAGHGGMKFPVTRNLVHSHFCPHCANGDGVCGNGRGSQWTVLDEAASLHGSHESPRTILYSGGTIEVELWVTVGHKGIFTLELCANPGDTITSDCFKRLERDPSDERVSPYLDAYPDIVFMLDDECMTRATFDSPARVRFLIPETQPFAEHAILRMFWNTGHQCSPHRATTADAVDPRIDRFETDFNGVVCKTAVSNSGLCGEDCPNSKCGGEKFINCADVVVLPSKHREQITADTHQTVPISEGVTPPPFFTSPPSSLATSNTEPAFASPDQVSSCDNGLFSPNSASLTTPAKAASSSSATLITEPPNSTTENPTLITESTPTTTSESANLTLGATSGTAATTNSQQPTSAGVGGPAKCPAGDEAECKTRVKGVYDWANSYCAERCHSLNSGDDATGQRWCATKNYCQLTECVLAFYSTTCIAA
eukprot:Gregarina_sp_Pseudo_9__3710@NODE_385_length_2977_cov_40_988428_g363_i0_p1_GENE_NODE_385_length_2977_cov_40_988428_g363_i0NODE_385_length_2977_cov_40_988428_g363_i0_p1_ORF_typecomplete_len438_score36_08LPMO_10/PF03067_15/1_1e08LPMO_10/PF03067_15/2_4e03_NODE_385_length_2977_cov_40_988428_g363_i014852798